MARKTGIDRASGEFIIHVDGDDYLEPDAIEGLAGRQHETDADIVVSDYFSEMEDGSGRKMCTDYHFDVLDGKTFLRALLTEEKYFIWGKLIRTSLCREISIPHDIHYTEDMVGMVQLAALARTVAKLDRPLYHYIKRSGAFTHAPGARSFKDWYRAVRLTGAYCRALPDGAHFWTGKPSRQTAICGTPAQPAITGRTSAPWSGSFCSITGTKGGTPWRNCREATGCS